MHEELNNIYVKQESKRKIVSDLKGNDEWQESGALKVRSEQDNTEEIFKPSLLRDIFGGIFQTTFHIDGSKVVKTQQEPFFVLNLEIPYEYGPTLKSCLKSYF